MRAVDEQLLHDLVVNEVQTKYSRIHKEVYVNSGEAKNREVKGTYPDIVFGGYGQITQIIEVETENTLTTERAAYWEQLAATGVQCTLLVPKKCQRLVTDLIWKTGLMAKVKVA
ncbi:MAG: hypothetical protein JXD19_02110, partial [Deltaproteobacteria bacterium]|nr:hypothetical protein [Deltaproteobacteria bacterium]